MFIILEAFEHPKSFYNIMLITNIVFCIIIFLAYLMQNVYPFIVLLKKNKKLKEASKEHHFAILICAHNEENVISDLIESINQQNYDKDKIQVFVVADNSNDKTAKFARQKGATVYERSSNFKGKSYALDFGIKQILRTKKVSNIDALLILDADNILDNNYLYEMNKLYSNGFQVGNSFRNTKNFSDNWLTRGASMMFLRESTIIHEGRNRLGISSYLAGTGFYIDFNIIRNLKSWPFHLITEDLEFTSYCLKNNIKIGYNENAIFYDEQPITLKSTINQRLRWCRGNHQCFFKRGFGLLKRPTISHLEFLAHLAPLPAFTFFFTISYLTTMFSLSCVSAGFSVGSVLFLKNIFIPSLLTGLIVIAIASLNAIIVLLKKRKLINASFKDKLLSIIDYPIFMLLFLPISFIALFMPVKWKKIEHVKKANFIAEK